MDGWVDWWMEGWMGGWVDPITTPPACETDVHVDCLID